MKIQASNSTYVDERTNVIYDEQSFARHSCSSNVSAVLRRGSRGEVISELICEAPIAAGEEITVARTASIDRMRSTAERQTELRSFGINCSCGRCRSSVIDIARVYHCGVCTAPVLAYGAAAVQPHAHCHNTPQLAADYLRRVAQEEDSLLIYIMELCQLQRNSSSSSSDIQIIGAHNDGANQFPLLWASQHFLYLRWLAILAVPVIMRARSSSNSSSSKQKMLAQRMALQTEFIMRAELAVMHRQGVMLPAPAAAAVMAGGADAAAVVVLTQAESDQQWNDAFLAQLSAVTAAIASEATASAATTPKASSSNRLLICTNEQITSFYQSAAQRFGLNRMEENDFFAAAVANAAQFSVIPIASLPHVHHRKRVLRWSVLFACGELNRMGRSLPAHSATELSVMTHDYIEIREDLTVLHEQMQAVCFAEHCVTTEAAMRCGGCKVARYCSSECQKQHWKQEHKLHCYSLTTPLRGGE